MSNINHNKFNERFNELVNSIRENNCFFFSCEKYKTVPHDVKIAKIKCKMLVHYRPIRQFEVFQVLD